MFNFQDIYHIGIRVPNLEEAMHEMGSSLDITWAEPVHTEAQSVWTPSEGQQKLPLKFVYSCDGPQHLELLEGQLIQFGTGVKFWSPPCRCLGR